MVVAGAVLYALGRTLGAIQTVLRLQRPRPLTTDEAAVVRRVFRDSLDPDAIRVVTGRAGLFGVTGRALTIGTTVYLKAFDSTARVDVLAHECAHVWQYRQVGTRYLAQAVWAQWFVPDAYDWRAELARGHPTWLRFNREAQAQLVQDVYRGTDGRFFDDDPPSGHFNYDGTDYTDLARHGVEQLRHPKEHYDRPRRLLTRRPPGAGDRRQPRSGIRVRRRPRT